MNQTRQLSCEERITDELESTLETLQALWAAYTGAECSVCEGTGEVNDPAREAYEGSANAEDTAPCPACEGSGKVGDEDGNHPEHGHLSEYGLSFGYVAPETFEGQEEGYFRYQLSWGGPSDEFRIYANPGPRGWIVYRVEYWFLDWFDGAKQTLHGEARQLIENIVDDFDGCDVLNQAYHKAMEY